MLSFNPGPWSTRSMRRRNPAGRWSSARGEGMGRDGSDPAGVLAPVPGAEPGQAERPKFKSIDQSIRRLDAETDSRVKPADEVESVLDNAPANALYRPV